MVQTLEPYEFIHRALLRHEVSTRNKHRFKGLRKASFSHEGPAEGWCSIYYTRCTTYVIMIITYNVYNI